jgi:3-isopropylmalate dehydrogenase
MFGAITSKGKDVADKELAPDLQGKGFTYRSPIVHMRQLLDLFICLRPCKAYPGNPLNYKENIDLVIFRENTEGMYIGVEYAQVPEPFYAVKGMEKLPRDAAISLRAITPGSSGIAERPSSTRRRGYSRAPPFMGNVQQTDAVS